MGTRSPECTVLTVESVSKIQWKTLSHKEKIPRQSELKEETQYGLLLSMYICTHVHDYPSVQVHMQEYAYPCMHAHTHKHIHTLTHYSYCCSSSNNTVLKWSLFTDLIQWFIIHVLQLYMLIYLPSRNRKLEYSLLMEQYERLIMV